MIHSHNCSILTDLFVAALMGHVGVVKTLLEKGTDVNCKSKVNSMQTVRRSISISFCRTATLHFMLPSKLISLKW